MCSAAELFAWPHCRVPHLWVAHPQKMIHWIPWGGCPPWGLLGTTFTGQTGSSPQDQTLDRCPCVSWLMPVRVS